MAKSREDSEKGQRIAELGRAVRRAGRHTVLFHQAIADRMGLSAVDSRALSYLQEVGPVPAGRLAALTGLTTGAITGMIDRLERAGLARRERDPLDRRKVNVVPISDPDRERAAEQLFAPLGRAYVELAAGYGEDELATILDFVNRASDMLRDQTSALLGEDVSEET